MTQTVPADPTNPLSPTIKVTTPVRANIGDFDEYGAFVMGKLENIGPGNLNYFLAGAMSKTHPNENLFSLPFGDFNGDGVVDNAGFGLLYDDQDPFTPGGQGKESHTGSFVYLGARYDLKKTGTSLGAEFNYGSKFWFTFVPAGDDIWTSKLGTKGEVYEVYLVQELNKKPIAKRGRAFVRLGYQYYNFRYTGSNLFFGEPKKISELTSTDPSKTQLLAPLKNAKDLYFTFDVVF